MIYACIILSFIKFTEDSKSNEGVCYVYMIIIIIMNIYICVCVCNIWNESDIYVAVHTESN